MSSTEIIDLNPLLGKPKKVRLGTKIYTLPAQIPVELYLLIKQRQADRAEKIEKGEDAEDLDVVQEVHRQVLELFQIHHPDLKSVPCGMSQLFEIIPTIYPPKNVPGEDDADDPTSGKTPGRRGSGSSTRRPAKRSKPR